MRKILTALPVKAQDLETALHAMCDSGHWEGEVQLATVKDPATYQNMYWLELVTEE